MTRQEAIGAAPKSQAIYWSWLVLAVLCSVSFLGLAVFIMQRSVFFAAGVASMALVVGAMAAQAAERIFYPERAAVRSASLSDRQRLWMKRWRTLLIAFFFVVGAISILLVCFSETQLQLSNLLRIYLWTPYMLAVMIADVQGERIGGPGVTAQHGADIFPGDLAPLRSEHWGEQS